MREEEEARHILVLRILLENIKEADDSSCLQKGLLAGVRVERRLIFHCIFVLFML